MRTLLVAVLWYRVSLGLAFGPLTNVPTTTASRRAVRTWDRPRGAQPGQTLFSQDQAEPIVVQRPKNAADNKPAGGGNGGGWGTWTKEESQREEQARVLEKFRKNDDGVAPGLRVRIAQKEDMLTVSHLCVDTFRGPFEWWMLPVQLFQEFSFFGQINGRLGRVTRNDIQHGMVVVEDTKSRKVVGFLEIGMLPKPTTSEQSALEGAAIEAATVVAEESKMAKEGEDEGASPGREHSEEGDDGVNVGVHGDRENSVAFVRAPDVAYLANVVVDRTQRRRGIGRTMVNSAIEIIRELWPAEQRIYVTVEQGNDIAVALYEGMGFEMTALEDEMLARSRKRPARIYLSKSLA